MKLASLAALSLLLTLSRPAQAFCGFYVAKADAKIYNHASQVVIARDDDKTILTISNDFQGPLKEFAEVIPVPSVLHKDQVHIGERKLLERIDAYSSPRLVEYFDEDPCNQRRYEEEDRAMPATAIAAAPMGGAARAKSLGVTIEAAYTVGEYDIVILSAKQSTGLETWLREEGYKIPAKAAAALEPYIKQDMKFFVAKVNLKKAAEGGFTYLRPIQIAYQSPKFMLPIRLGMANANGPQDLTVYTLTRKGRVESSNYRTVPMPTGMNVPIFVKDDFKPFYLATFERAYRKEDKRAVFTEYAWDSSNCDPCADTPLDNGELKGLGVSGSTTPTRASRRWSRASTFATSAPASRRTSSSRRPATARTSRRATSCNTPGRAPPTARRGRPTGNSSRPATPRRPPLWRASPAGSSRTSTRRWATTRRASRRPTTAGTTSSGNNVRTPSVVVKGGARGRALLCTERGRSDRAGPPRARAPVHEGLPGARPDGRGDRGVVAAWLAQRDGALALLLQPAGRRDRRARRAARQRPASALTGQRPLTGCRRWLGSAGLQHERPRAT